MSSETIVDVLESHAGRQPDAMAFTFLKDNTCIESITFGELAAQARCIAARLGERRASGSPVGILYSPGVDFIRNLLGCLYAGAIAVPLAASNLRVAEQRIARIVGAAGINLVLAHSSLKTKLRAANFPPHVTVHTWNREDLQGGEIMETREARATDVALVQYTSGSTADPRGVALTHSNLLANQEQIAHAFGHDTTTVVGSWLPLHHDMGLIGHVLHTIWLGVPCYHMSPMEFIRKPDLWLRMISDYGVTTSGGPSFAYDLCSHTIPDPVSDSIDLRRWTVAFSGAEVIRSSTLHRFADKFRTRGFRSAAFLPCYGLAEATLFATGTRRNTFPLEMDIDLASLETNGDIYPPKEDLAKRTVVSCGAPAVGLTLKIVDPAQLVELDESHVGEIWLAGPNVAREYWGAGSHALTDNHLPGDDQSYLRTGDLGFLREHTLYVVGRIKDTIIIRGRKHSPDDLEFVASSAHHALAGMGGAAFGVAGDEGEELIIVHEVRRDELSVLTPLELERSVVEAITKTHGITPKTFVAVLPRSLPRTTSGKIQRNLVRQLYLQSSLRVAT